MAVHGDVFQEPRIQPAVLVVGGRRQIAVVLIRIERSVEIDVFAIEYVQICPVHQAQLIDRFEGRVLAQVRGIEPQVGVRFRPAGRVVVAAAPGNDVGGQLRCHAGKR